MREEGYYWVLHRDTWEIAKWFNGGIQGWSWDLGGFGQFDNDFDEIDERRITRES